MISNTFKVITTDGDVMESFAVKIDGDNVSIDPIVDSFDVGEYRIQVKFEATDESGLSTKQTDVNACDFQLEIVNQQPIPVLEVVDQKKECTGPMTPVTFNVSKSSDLNGHELTYSWANNGVDQTDESGTWTDDTRTVELLVGNHSITVTACDKYGSCGTTEPITVEITDTTVS